MNRFLSVLGVGLVLMVDGCAFFIPKESVYLRVAAGKATQEDVQSQLGKPRSVTVLSDGEAQWLYEVRDLEPMSQSSWSTLGSWCDEYRLTFDGTGVLREWSHASYLHAGELMPATCNGAVAVQKPAL
ncbi:MAG: hypothetical protein KF814_17145 [Nitrospiraceae bacterium]|nr:hypothetical protein [Nitrospiraceae bacterium]